MEDMWILEICLSVNASQFPDTWNYPANWRPLLNSNPHLGCCTITDGNIWPLGNSPLEATGYGGVSFKNRVNSDHCLLGN